MKRIFSLLFACLPLLSGGRAVASIASVGVSNAPYKAPVNWVPTNISNSVLWLRSDKGVSLDGSNNISTWSDQSGHGYNLAQSTSALRPAFVSSGGAAGWGYASYPGAGGNHNLVGTGVLVNQALEYVVVANSSAASPAGPHYLVDDGSNNNILDRQANLTTLIQYDGTSLANSLALTVGADFVVDSFFNGASSQQTLNGGAAASGGNPGTNTTALPFVLGASGAAANVEWGGKIYEIVVYSRALTTTERLNVTRYAGARYSIVVP